MEQRKGKHPVSFAHKKLILFIVVGALIVFMTTVFTLRFFGVGNGVKTDAYQLVSLTTGERYIGKLSTVSGEYVTLSEVYYQQETEQQSAEGESTQVQSQSQITVAKLSSSVAKPEDIMRISRDKIVHWENLQEDSKIVQAIRQGQNQ